MRWSTDEALDVTDPNEPDLYEIGNGEARYSEKECGASNPWHVQGSHVPGVVWNAPQMLQPF